MFGDLEIIALNQRQRIPYGDCLMEKLKTWNIQQRSCWQWLNCLSVRNAYILLVSLSTYDPGHLSDSYIWLVLTEKKLIYLLLIEIHMGDQKLPSTSTQLTLSKMNQGQQ